MMPTAADLQLWRDIRTHADFGRATVAWLEGRCNYIPGYFESPPDDETSELIPMLAEINNHGFVTTCSQPGIPIDEHGGQRAFVEGICSEDTARQVCSALRGTDLIVLAFPPLKGGDGQIVVTLDGGEEFTWLGIHNSLYGALSYYEEVGRELGDLVLSSWTLQIFDPVWGRNYRLWPGVLGALTGGRHNAC